MAEVIGIVASIVGIVAAASKVAELFGYSAPGLLSLQPNAKALSAEVSSTSLVLNPLQRLILDPDLIPVARRDMIQLEDLVTLMTHGVQLFSEIEDMVRKLGQPSDTFRSRTRWGRKEKDLGSMYQRLNAFRGNVSFMLNVLQCASDLEASQSRIDLRNAVDQLLQSNQSLASRVASCERYSIRSYHTASETSDRYSTTSEVTVRHAGNASSVDDSSDGLSTRTDSTVRQTPARPELSPQSRTVSEPIFGFARHFAFEEDLERSRPYLIATRASMDNSFRSSVAHSHAWSSLSLSDLSLLSVIALPLTCSEISNSEHYSVANVQSAREALVLESASSLAENEPVSSGPPCVLCTAASDTFFCDVCNRGICCGCLDTGKIENGLISDSDADSAIGSWSVKTASTGASSREQRWHLQDEDATWLDVESDVLGTPFVVAYDRLSDLWAESDYTGSQYPRLVSFLGPTCAGKSALIKLLIELKDWEGGLSRSWTSPVSDDLQSGKPTTTGLRLYSDPSTQTSCDPILFVDCQGLDARGTVPVATSYQQILRPSGLLSVQACLAQNIDAARREWLNAGAPMVKCRASKPSSVLARSSMGVQDTLNYAANELYPRLLMMVSSTIVFVMPSKLSHDELRSYIIRLLRWASEANNLKNGYGRPHLIIVSPLWIGQGHRLETPETATAAFMACLDQQIPLSTIDEDILASCGHAERPVSSTDELLTRCYKTIHVVPVDNMRYDLGGFDPEIEQLYAIIASTCDGSLYLPKGAASWTPEGLRHRFRQAVSSFTQSADAPLHVAWS